MRLALAWWANANKSASEREQSQINLSYAEYEQIKDDIVGLKRKLKHKNINYDAPKKWCKTYN